MSSLNHLFKIFKTTITFLLWTITAVTMTCILLPFALLPKKWRFQNSWYYFIMSYGSKIIIKTSFIKIKVVGQENLFQTFQQASIFAVNHTSALDIPLVQALVGKNPHIWFSKATYSKIPLFGFILRRMNFLVKREHPTQAARTLEAAQEFLRTNNCNVLIFPEGRRYNDGTLHKFYSGFAVLAQKLNRPIIPITIYDLHKIFPKHSILLDSKATTVTIIIGKPMWYTDAQTRQDFVDQVHALMAQEYNRLAKNV